MPVLPWLRSLLPGARRRHPPPDPHAPLPDEMLATIQGYVNAIQERFSLEAGRPMPPGAEGAAFLDFRIEGIRKEIRRRSIERVSEALGCYLGACVIEACGGRWTHHPWGLAVMFDNGQYVFPFAKAWKRLKHGPEDSILQFFNMAVTSARPPDSSDGPLVEAPDSV